MANNEAIPLLIGTSNPAKSIRLANCFSSELFRFVFPESISEGNIPEETADTHESIPVEKAKYWSSKANGFAVSSDGGLKKPILKDNGKSNVIANPLCIKLPLNCFNEFRIIPTVTRRIPKPP